MSFQKSRKLRASVGDIIAFRISVCGYAVPRGIIRRKIKAFDGAGRPLVRFAGYSDFKVRLSEVVGVEKMSNA